MRALLRRPLIPRSTKFCCPLFAGLRMKRKELLLMLLPCLLFAGTAFWMRWREARWPSDGKFHLVIEKIETRPLSAKDAAEGYDTEVVAILNYVGPKAEWWGKQSGGVGDASSKARLFYEADGESKPVKMPPSFKEEPSIFYWRPSWKSQSARYEARFFLPLSKLPPRPEKTVLRGKIFIEDGSVYPHITLSESVPFAYTVREAKQLIPAPPVSRAPLLRVVKTHINRPNAAQQKLNGGYDTMVHVHLEDFGPMETTGSAIGGYYIVDEQGTTLHNSGGSSSGSDTSNPRRPVLKFDCGLQALRRAQRNLFAKMKFSRGDRWPLIVKVPLRLNGKDLKGEVKAIAAPPP